MANDCEHKNVADALAEAIHAFMRGDGDFADQMAEALDAWHDLDRRGKKIPIDQQSGSPDNGDSR